MWLFRMRGHRAERRVFTAWNRLRSDQTSATRQVSPGVLCGLFQNHDEEDCIPTIHEQGADRMALLRACKRGVNLEAINMGFNHVAALGIQVESLIETCQGFVQSP